MFKISSLEDKAKDRAQKMGTIIQTKSGQEESSNGHALNPLLTSRKHELQSLSHLLLKNGVVLLLKIIIILMILKNQKGRVNL